MQDFFYRKKCTLVLIPHNTSLNPLCTEALLVLNILPGKLIDHTTNQYCYYKVLGTTNIVQPRNVPQSFFNKHDIQFNCPYTKKARIAFSERLLWRLGIQIPKLNCGFCWPLVLLCGMAKGEERVEKQELRKIQANLLVGSYKRIHSALFKHKIVPQLLIGSWKLCLKLLKAISES